MNQWPARKDDVKDQLQLKPPEWVAARFGVTRKRVYELASHPDDPIPAYKIGRTIRFDETEVDDWIARRRKATRSSAAPAAADSPRQHSAERIR